MADSIFEKTVSFDVPRDVAFQWHRADKAFARLLPPWENVIVESKNGGIEGGTVNLKTYAGPVPVRWVAEHSQYVENEQFFDKSLSGPFKKWEHTHRFDSAGALASSTDQSSLTDHIEYRLRGGFLASMVMGGWVKKKLARMFEYRHEVTKSDLEDHFQFSDQARKTIAITGASGLVGKALVPFLENGGHTVISLGRKTEIQPGDMGWNPETGQVGFGEHEKVDCFVHLAGYGIADKRWSDKVKEKIRSSRGDATEKLCDFLLNGDPRGKLVRESFICASATGYYGDRADELLNEDSERGTGFLADISGDWEAASAKMEDSGVRVAKLRFGILLNQNGGALSKLLLPFGLGLGGRVGSGQQFWSWISHLDALRAIHFAIMSEGICGPVNVVAPHAVKVNEFAKTLGKVLRRPTFLPFPAFAAKIMLGEMADHLLLASCRVEPRELLKSGFRFNHETLEQALRFELGRKAN